MSEGINAASGESPELTPVERQLITFILDDIECWGRSPSFAEIARELRVSRTRAFLLVTRLARAGALDCISTERGVGYSLHRAAAASQRTLDMMREAGIDVDPVTGQIQISDDGEPLRQGACDATVTEFTGAGAAPLKQVFRLHQGAPVPSGDSAATIAADQAEPFAAAQEERIRKIVADASTARDYVLKINEAGLIVGSQVGATTAEMTLEAGSTYGAPVGTPIAEGGGQSRRTLHECPSAEKPPRQGTVRRVLGTLMSRARALLLRGHQHHAR